MLIANIPPVELSALFRDIESTTIKFAEDVKCNIIDAGMKEVDEITIERYIVPSKEELINARKDSPLSWDPISSFTKSDPQSNYSYDEYKLAMEYFSDAIDSYLELTNKSL